MIYTVVEKVHPANGGGIRTHEVNAFSMSNALMLAAACTMDSSIELTIGEKVTEKAAPDPAAAADSGSEKGA